MTVYDQPLGDPILIASEIERITITLGKIATELGATTQQLADAELAYGDLFEAELVVLFEEYEDKGVRLPGEDVRRALIHKRIDRAAYREVRRLSGRQEALQQYARINSTRLSGLQSALSALKAENAGPSVNARPKRPVYE